MQSNWIDTRDIYHTIINAPDMATREQQYTERILSTWGPMMRMAAMHMGGASDDPFAGARGWHWLVPEQLTTPPAILNQLEAANAWTIGADAMALAVQRFAPYADQIPLETIEGWLVLADTETSDPINRGYVGGIDFMHPRFVVQFSEANAYTLPRLGGCIVHEMHHLIRTKVAPWNIMEATVADYIVHEGLAESFAGALFGDDVIGYYVTEFDESELNTARTLIGENLETTGFDKLRGFVFGDYWAAKMGFAAVGMPTFGGYAVGYHIVQAYLKRTGRTIEAATFVPAAEIVAESGYFQLG